MAPEVKTAKNSKLPKMSENCFEPVGKGGRPPISIWIISPLEMIKEIFYSWNKVSVIDFDFI